MLPNIQPKPSLAQLEITFLFLITKRNVMSIFYLLDKICDQISDAVLDAHLSFDPDAKVCVGKTIDYQQICKEIKHAVSHGKSNDDVGAGDQGLMFGYATDETEECMPLTLLLVHKLTASRKTLKWNGTWPWLRPGGKTQVCKVDNSSMVLCRRQTKVHARGWDSIIGVTGRQKEGGRIVPSGPCSDPGLTGRKIIGTYGGWGSHGRGAFSGKDPSKVDCSAAYAAQWITKSLVKAGLCKRVLTQVRATMKVKHHNRNSVSCVLTPTEYMLPSQPHSRAGFQEARPIYQKPACYGHFGREEYTWEIPKKLLY
uniref:methionine adenosyltransferase n=1 Tax=Otus sunia TaxID=257818 RepID=A0A8C8BP11_9STRI